jgi:hypothetical protein
VSNQSPLSSAAIVARGSGLIEAEVDGEVVALHIDKGMCYGLNKTGSRIWRMIAQPIRIDAVCAGLIAECQVDAATCARDVLDLLEELRAEGLIEVREGSLQQPT